MGYAGLSSGRQPGRFRIKKKKILYAALVNGRIAVANDVSFFPPQKNLKNILKIVK